MKDLNIVAIGGGTGLSTLLRGLKHYNDNITAVVTVADDGGSSGRLRKELGVLPPGDIRNCLVALCEEENLMSRLFQHRFKSKGSLAGHSFGNLFLTAMSDIAGSFDNAIAQSAQVLAIKGRVLPVTLADVLIEAELENGKKVRGESAVSKTAGKIKNISLVPKMPKAAPAVLESLKNADVIILGPGSLYTSVIVNLCVAGITDAIKASKARVIYVLNIMTQPGETDGYTLSDHIKAIENHSYKGIVDYAIVNSAKIPDNIAKRYKKQGASLVKIDKSGVKEVKRKLYLNEFYARHDSVKLAKTIADIFRKEGK